MIPTSEGWLRREGVELHYVEWNAEEGASDAPAVLLLHGLSSNARYWDRVAGHLRGRRVVALDQRGHGRTGSASGRFGMQDLLLDAAQAAVQLGLDAPVVVGHSWGAAVALELVAANEGLAAGLVFVDGPLMGLAKFLDWDQVQALMQPPLPRYAALEDAIADSKNHFEEAWGDDLRPFAEAGVAKDGDGWILSLTESARHAMLHDLHRSNPEHLWPKVTVPASVLVARHGEARIARWTEMGVEGLRDIAPSVTVVRFDTPHDIPLYAPAEVAQEIEHLARRAKRVSA